MEQERGGRGRGGGRLEVRAAEHYKKRWETCAVVDGARRWTTIYEPVAPAGSFAVADVVEQSSEQRQEPSAPIALTLAQRAGGQDDRPLLCFPLDYQPVWSSPAHGLFLFWPIAPAGYHAMGLVASCGAEKPSLRRVVCVTKEWALPARPVGEEGGGPLAALPELQGHASTCIWRIEGAVAALDGHGEPLALQLHTFAALQGPCRGEAPFWTVRNPHHRDVATDRAPVHSVPPVTAAVAVTAPPLGRGEPGLAQSMPILHGQGKSFLLAEGRQRPLSHVVSSQAPLQQAPLQQPPPQVTYCEFEVTEQKAKELYFAWVETHWCSTTTLRKQMSSCMLSRVYIPHWVFTVKAVLTPVQAPSGQPPGEASKANASEGAAAMEGDQTCAKKAITVELEDLVCCAVPEQDTAAWAREVDGWRLSRMRQGQLRAPAEQCGDWRVSWSQLQAELREEELARGTRLAVAACSYRLAFLPAYRGAVLLDGGGRCYRFLVNGQTGACTGERPLGLGVLGSGLVAIEQLFRKQRPLVGLHSGQALARRDGSALYEPQGWYLAFPPSRKAILSSDVGWVRVRNQGAAPVSLAACQRPSGQWSGAPPLWLAPGEAATLAYRGSWCLHVADGDATDVHVEEQSPSGGAEHEDTLAMAK